MTSILKWLLPFSSCIWHFLTLLSGQEWLSISNMSSVEESISSWQKCERRVKKDLTCFSVGQCIWAFFIIVVTYRAAMYISVGCALNKSVTCEGNFHITDIVNRHFITAFTWKIKYPIQSKLLYYDNFITDGSKAHGCYRAGLLWLTARVIISSNDDLLFSDFHSPS